jgi:imidazolonepropionase-like amidohydrolase
MGRKEEAKLVYLPRELRRYLLAFVLAVWSFALAAWPSAASPRQVTLDHGAQDPAISPDGAQIAVSILGHIYLIPIGGGDAAQLTDGIGWDTHPAWSPDGRFLAFAHQLARGTDLAVLNLATKSVVLIHHTEAQIGPIVYAPRGDEIFFGLRISQYDAHIQRISPAGGEVKPVTETEGWHEWSFAISRDGHDLLAESGHYGGANLYRIHLEDRKATRLTHTEASQKQVAWTHDGQSFAYIESAQGVETVFAQPAAGGDRRAIYSSPFRDTQLALGPDDKFAVLCAARRLTRLDLATGEIKPIPFRAKLVLPEQGPANLVIAHARLIDGTGAAPVEDATIEIRDGRFSAIKSGASPTPVGAQVIDGGGRTVLPGLMDNHYHYWDPFEGGRLLSHGVTSVRDPGVALSEGQNYKEANALGIMPGPDIHTAGPLIDGFGGYHPMVDVEIDDPAKAAALVDSLKEQGVDLLKVYFLLNPEVACAVISEAHKIGLKVTGHIGVRTSWTKAIGCGIDGVNHIRIWADYLPLSDQPQGENSSLDGKIHTMARMQGDWSKIDPSGAQVAPLIDLMASHHIGFDPTLFIQKTGDGERKSFNLEEFSVSQDTFTRMGAFVQRAQKAGALLLAGTDDVSLFDELEAYESAGVDRGAIIQAATSDGALWLGKQAEFGTVAPGRRADLIIVDGDPLKQIKDMRNIRTVVKDGRIVFEK